MRSFISLLTFLCFSLLAFSHAHHLHPHAIRAEAKKTCPASGRSSTPKKSGCTWVVPGTGRFTHSKVFDFTKLKQRPEFLYPSNYALTIGTGAFKGAKQAYNKDNVAVKEGSLQLKVPAKHTKSKIEGAQIETMEHDIQYASVRTTARISGVPGVCHGRSYMPAF